ncbi:MAG: hypothetical protein ACOYJL_08820 [Tractidigestivibacter sp.]|uniref:hypothetical protein n=1 Tax=Tractidigestivibacter sp. TaxID=2847320 RepID=UPI003D8F9869
MTEGRRRGAWRGLLATSILMALVVTGFFFGTTKSAFADQVETVQENATSQTVQMETDAAGSSDATTASSETSSLAASETDTSSDADSTASEVDATVDATNDTESDANATALVAATDANEVATNAPTGVH